MQGKAEKQDLFGPSPQGMATPGFRTAAATRALKGNGDLYMQLVDFIPDMIIHSDLDGKILFVNEYALRISGYTREEIEGRSIFMFVHPADRQNAIQKFRIMTEGRLGPREYTLITKDGRQILFEVNGDVLRGPDGVPFSVVSVCRDISGRKRAEKEFRRILERLRNAVGVTIQVMVSAVEARDPYTAGHQLRTADLARAIGTGMGLSQDKVDGIRMAGSIHDIGKLSIPAEILSKPTQLSKLEFSLIKEHPRKGYEMLKDVESPWPLAQIVLQHHERMDGSGYPQNLKGDAILVEARIMAVADVVESTASNRPSRPALGLNAALEEIKRNSGILYDGSVVDACLHLFRKKGYQFPSSQPL